MKPFRETHTRRRFLASAAAAALLGGRAARAAESRPPNLLFVLADQWRAQAFGYAGDPNARTPAIDRLTAESVRFTHAVSSCPVCSPYRASLLTGRRALTHGVFINDVPLNNEAVSIAQAFNGAGYATAYIGKWHVDGSGSRSAFIPRERRQGFQFWKVLECTHDYNRSAYYGDENRKLFWDGYDAMAQTREARSYIHERDRGRPFALFLSWGPPHDPYHTAPPEHRARFEADKLVLRPNVPPAAAAAARRDLAGYYAHGAALDACLGDLLATLQECGVAEDTVVVFTSDHGDMLGSQGQRMKQRPWDESILVPLLIRLPAASGRTPRVIDMPLSAPDLMPTLLGLCNVAVPSTVEGRNCAAIVRGATSPTEDRAALILCAAPFGQWTRGQGGREYRGIRTSRYTYVRDRSGPWLLYDTAEDPYQQRNLCGVPEHAALQKALDDALARELSAARDEFLPAAAYIERWGYKVDASGTMPYTS